MVELRVTSLTGDESALEGAAVEGLRAGLRGQLLQPGSDGYDEARRLWNSMIDRKPALIARCVGVADVIDSVNFARAHGLRVAVKGGGHHIAGNALCDGGIVIDLSPMKAVRVDPIARTARAEAGLTWLELDHETQAFGLATVGGTVSDTGVAGLTLGGGIGWIGRKCGMTCDNLLSVDLVTAQGSVVTASATENPDLFWGVRGGGGNFGIATSFEFRVHPVGQLLGGMVVHSFERASEVLKLYRDFSIDAPDEVNTIATLFRSEDGTPVVSIAVCYYGAVEDGERALAPLRAYGSPIEDSIRPMSYAQLQTMLDRDTPPGRRYYQKSNFMTDISDGAIETLLKGFDAMPSPLSGAIFQQMGGAASRVAPDATAFTHRDAQYDFVVTSAWTDSQYDEPNIRWVREVWDAMGPYYSSGVYINATNEDSQDRVKDSYDDDSYQRLVALKNKYDPGNMFRLNHNVRPAV